MIVFGNVRQLSSVGSSAHRRSRLAQNGMTVLMPPDGIV